ncbi:unnamed protein product [Symbiodinium sp. KB8]|nr:unnamed protein product [Symbiodinium sp. KB8]
MSNFFFDLFYERYADGGGTESIQYVGSGMGHMESKLTEVGAGRGSYTKEQRVTYGYRCRPAAVCGCVFLCLLALLPFLWVCEVRSFFTGETCGAGRDDLGCDACLAAPHSPTLMNTVRGVPTVRGQAADFCCSQCGVNCYDPITTTEAPRVVVRRHYNTVVRRVPVNHYVKVQMPRPAPIIHTVHVVATALGCPKQVVDRNIYHHVTKIQKLHVPVPVQEPRGPPIIHNIPQVYHVPSPPKYVHVPVPGPKVHKVTINKDVPYPVKVITVKKPYTVKVPGHRHYVDVPVPSPPHIVNKYKYHYVTVHDYNCDSHFDKWYYAWSGAKKQWCCAHQHLGCPGSWHHHHVVTITGVHHLKHYDCHAGLSNWYHGWSHVKKSWCCDHHQLGCPGMAHGQWHAHTVVHTIMGHHAGHGGYDCDAGYSNWEHGWPQP